MPSPERVRQALQRLFQRQRTAQLKDLFTALKTRSRMTVFRRLSLVGYLSSYNHAGRYYTAADVPEFDHDGLWQHAGACFSRDGTLKDTVARLVETADAGLLHRELQLRLQVRVYNTLADLLQDGRIGREHLESEYLYVSAESKRATVQVAHRRHQIDELVKNSEGINAAIDPSLVIEVLIEVIHGSVVHLDTQQVVARLTIRGVAVTAAQVEEIFQRHGVEKNGTVSLATLAALRQQLALLQAKEKSQVHSTSGVHAFIDERPGPCVICNGLMVVQKTIQRHCTTLEHGPFHIHETVYVCAARCTKDGGKSTCRAQTLATRIPPKGVVGYDVIALVGYQRFVNNRQREEIRNVLQSEHGITLSDGEISHLGRRFLGYFEMLHTKRAPELRKALERDGGWPLHIDATGEDGRGTLLAAYAGWRHWVLGAWKIPTERSETILPKLRVVVTQFGVPCAIMRDLGRAMKDAADGLVCGLDRPVPIVACHLHFLRDVGKDLLTAAHDDLRGHFRRFRVKPRLRALARDIGRALGNQIAQARKGLLDWQHGDHDHVLAKGDAGLATIRAVAQWVLDYHVDGQDQGFPFDLPYLDLHDRCQMACRAVDAFLRHPVTDAKVNKNLRRLRRILAPVDAQVPFKKVVATLRARAALFTELRNALQLRIKPSGKGPPPAVLTPEQAARELRDIKTAVDRLAASLVKRRPKRGPAQDERQAIDIVLTHLSDHGRFLWGHVITLPVELGGGIRLVDRTNNVVEGLFHHFKRGERRRSGRKNLSQDMEQLPPAALLTLNLKDPDYVAILCGSLDKLPQAFAELDAGNRRRSSLVVRAKARVADGTDCDIASASLPSEDRNLIRTDAMDHRIQAAARSRAPRS